MAKNKRFDLLGRIPPSCVVREELAETQEKVRHLTALLELCESVEGGKPLSADDETRAIKRPLETTGGRTHAGAH